MLCALRALLGRDVVGRVSRLHCCVSLIRRIYLPPGNSAASKRPGHFAELGASSNVFGHANPAIRAVGSGNQTILRRSAIFDLSRNLSLIGSITDIRADPRCLRLCMRIFSLYSPSWFGYNPAALQSICSLGVIGFVFDTQAANVSGLCWRYLIMHNLVVRSAVSAWQVHACGQVETG